MKLEKKINNETIKSFLFRFAGVLISFFSVPILIKYLGKESYGFWITISSVISWFLIFDFGFGNGLRNFLTKFLSQADNSNSRSVIISSYIIVIFISFLIFIIGCISLNFIDLSTVFNIHFLTNSEIKYLLIILLSGVCILFVLQLCQSLFYSIQEPSKVNLIRTLKQLFIFLIIILLTSTDNIFKNLFYITIINSSIPLIILFVFTFYFFYNNRGLIPKISDINLEIGRQVMSLGINMFILRLSSIFLLSILPFMFTRYIGPEMTAYYHICFKYFSIIKIAMAIILSPYWSAVTLKFENFQYSWIRKYLFKTFKFSILGCILIFIMLLFFNKIIVIWIGDTIQINYSIALWVSIFIGVFIITEPFILFINGIGKIKIQVVYSLFIIFFTVPLSLLFFYFTNLGFISFLLTPIIFRLIRSTHAFFQIINLTHAKNIK